MKQRRFSTKFEALEGRLVLAPVIDVGDHYLLPDTPDQVIPIYVSGGDLVEGCNLNVQIADGGPELGGLIDGPAITVIDLESGIFQNNNTGQIDPDNVASVTHTFEIANTGTADLHLTGNPLVQIIGDAAGDFVVTRQPSDVIHPGESTSFDVTFTPSQVGLRTAEVVIYNDDADENPYNFAIQGTGGDGSPQWEGRYIITNEGTVTANGLLAYITVDTTGFTSGSWDLILGEDNLNGSSDFAGVAAQITNGHIIINNKPVSQNDSYAVDEDSILNGTSVLTNDTDLDGDPLIANLVSGVQHGSLVFNADGTFVYTPNTNYNGSDSFVYITNDGHFDSDPTTVTITVNSVNDAPVGVDDAYVLNEDSTLTITSPGVLNNDSDIDGTSLVATVVTDVTHGELTLNVDGSFVYTPDTNYHGTDTFTYIANDGELDSNPITVTLTINPDVDIIGQFLVYNNSYWDGENPAVDVSDVIAIATDKVPLLEGETASYDNVSNYDKGINEVLIIFDDLTGNLTIDDFDFLIGNSNDPSTWVAAPEPMIVLENNYGAAGEDLVYLVWEDGTIKNEWLRVEIKATENTGLTEDNVFFFGSAIGDTGDSPTDLITNATDTVAIRQNPHIFINPATIDSPYDINRDSLVDATDMVVSRQNYTTFINALRLITPETISENTEETLEVPLVLPSPITSVEVVQTSSTHYTIELEVEAPTTKNDILALKRVVDTALLQTTNITKEQVVAAVTETVQDYPSLFSWAKGVNGKAVSRLTLDIQTDETAIDEVLEATETWVDCPVDENGELLMVA